MSGLDGAAGAVGSANPMIGYYETASPDMLLELS